MVQENFERVFVFGHGLITDDLADSWIRTDEGRFPQAVCDRKLYRNTTPKSVPILEYVEKFIFRAFDRPSLPTVR
jgi:hypothetical protein